MTRPQLWLVALLLAATTPWAQASGPTVAIPPFEIYNAPDVQALGPGLQAMLASRLASSTLPSTIACSISS